MLKVITVTNSPQHAMPLIRSLVANKWDYVLIEAEWKGFGTKLIETYHYLKANPEVDRFIFADAFDVLALGGPEEFEEKLFARDNMIVSCERGCWPDSELAKFYEPTYEHGFNFVNSGLYYAPSDLFIKLFEISPPDYETDDQLWLTKMYLFESNDIARDCGQVLFNSHSFIRDGEYGYENGRLQILGEESVFAHKNGRSVDEKLDNLMKQI